MNYDADLLDKIAEALINTDANAVYCFDRKGFEVVKTERIFASQFMNKPDYVEIEPMLPDLLELMEDFSLEQDTEEVQEHLLDVIKDKDENTAISNFRRVLFNYSKSKKAWETVERAWLTAKAKEFIEDYC